MKNSFLLYYEYREILEDLSNEEVGILFRAILDYEIDSIEPNFTGLLKMAFKVIKGNLDRDREKYDKRCETSAQNGRLGGRPRKLGEKPNSKPNSKPKKPKKADNDNETDADDEADNDDEIDADDEFRESADLSDSEESETNADLFTFIQKAFGRTLNDIEYEIINSWEDNELTRYAVKESILNGARGIRYVQTVLESWHAKGFKTIQDVKNYQEKYKRSQKKCHQTESKLPDWFNKDLKNEEMSKEDVNELDKILSDITESIKNINDN